MTPVYHRDHLPEGEWHTFRKTALTQMIRIDGPFTVLTSEGPLTCQDGFVAMDQRGYPYPLDAGEQTLIYEPVGPNRTAMRRFVGYRPNPPAEYLEKGTAAPPDEPQYEGVMFSDGTVALRWRTEFKSTSLWTSYDDFFHVHGHPEYGTVIDWLD